MVRTLITILDFFLRRRIFLGYFPWNRNTIDFNISSRFQVIPPTVKQKSFHPKLAKRARVLQLLRALYYYANPHESIARFNFPPRAYLSIFTAFHFTRSPTTIHLPPANSKKSPSPPWNVKTKQWSIFHPVPRRCVFPCWSYLLLLPIAFHICTTPRTRIIRRLRCHNPVNFTKRRPTCPEQNTKKTQRSIFHSCLLSAGHVVHWNHDDSLSRTAWKFYGQFNRAGCRRRSSRRRSEFGVAWKWPAMKIRIVKDAVVRSVLRRVKRSANAGEANGKNVIRSRPGVTDKNTSIKPAGRYAKRSLLFQRWPAREAVTTRPWRGLSFLSSLLRFRRELQFFFFFYSQRVVTLGHRQNLGSY